MVRRLWRTLAGFLVLLLVAGTALAENKLAFVVGINAYPNLSPDAQLLRGVNDAEAVGDALQSLGFEVTKVTKGPTLDTILSRFGQFLSTISPGDVVAFFYAGHGISLDDGVYLVPSDVPALEPTDELRAKRVAIAERDFTQQIRASGARVALIVIDACRDNPFPRRGTRAIGASTRGLGPLTPAEGVFTLYSAREGQTALDRLSDSDASRNSVFTRVFVEDLKKPGLSLSELGEAVRDEVAALARTAQHDQVPAVYNDLLGARTIFLAGREPTSGLSETNHSVNSPGAASAAHPVSKKPERLEQARLPQGTHDMPTFPRPTSPRETCARRPTSNGSVVYCASSVLPPQFGSSYGVQNLFGASTNAWVAGSQGFAIGEWILVEFDETRLITSIDLANGYQKSSDIFYKNSRVKTLEVLASSGDTQQFALEDRFGTQRLLFDRPIQVKWIELIIRGVFPGNKYTDTAISKLDVQSVSN